MEAKSIRITDFLFQHMLGQDHTAFVADDAAILSSETYQHHKQTVKRPVVIVFIEPDQPQVSSVRVSNFSPNKRLLFCVPRPGRPPQRYASMLHIADADVCRIGS
jgi:hypothetical protein